ncbi:MAG: hypothetical protein H0X27_07335 [Caulobacteraceae bacterium]|nr:hypothetical protein [Caulobacteraceae bacterium]
MTIQAATPPQGRGPGGVARRLLGHRGVRAAVVLWAAGYVVVLALAHGSLPFDRPAMAALSFAAQMAEPTLGLIEIFILIGLVFLLTRKRVIPDIAARAPDRAVAWRETLMLLGYAAGGQVGGWILGPLLGYRPFSFHIAGTLVGCAVPPRPGEVWTWALYNFTVFAAVPYLAFRRRYSDTQLNLRSTDRAGDLRLILIVCTVESAVELGAFGKALFGLTPRQVLMGAPLSFFVFFIGTVLPTMILIYAILLPRYLKLTGSTASTVLLGGLTYAAMHIVEGWSLFDSPKDTALSLIFVLFTYFGPGMIKSVLTLRTGNAWVHALGYHAIAPHTIVDTPLMVRSFGIAPS